MLRACDPHLQRRYYCAREMHRDLALLRAGHSLVRMRQTGARQRLILTSPLMGGGVILSLITAWYLRHRH